MVIFPQDPPAVLEILGLQAFDNVNASYATASRRRIRAPFRRDLFFA